MTVALSWFAHPFETCPFSPCGEAEKTLLAEGSPPAYIFRLEKDGSAAVSSLARAEGMVHNP